jgi:hypothetical protein
MSDKPKLLPNSGKGRPKGSPNKVPAALKDMILGALNNAGGVEYLERKANDPRTAAAFLGLVGKVLPLQVTGEDGKPVQTSMTINVIGVPGNPPT